MGYGDYTPSSGGRVKPLTKKQLEKAREAYANADKVTIHVKSLEAKEVKNAEEELKSLDMF